MRSASRPDLDDSFAASTAPFCLRCEAQPRTRDDQYCPHCRQVVERSLRRDHLVGVATWIAVPLAAALIWWLASR